MQDCQTKAAEKGLGMKLTCAEGLTATINAPLLEQAVVNLLDNAIKYSPKGTEIRIAAKAGAEESAAERREGETASGTGANADNGEVRITVQDQGTGIAAHHLPRLFERFYRVDAARSRELGGTGLGLAIVKHIALAHGGSVEVRSAPGQGAEFEIVLPE